MGIYNNPQKTKQKQTRDALRHISIFENSSKTYAVVTKNQTAQATGGFVVVDISDPTSPNKFIEKLTFPLLNAEIRFNKTMSFEQISEYRGFNQRLGKDTGSVTLVLGAGNVSSIPFLDVLFHLVAKRSSIILKLDSRKFPIFPPEHDCNKIKIIKTKKLFFIKPIFIFYFFYSLRSFY